MATVNKFFQLDDMTHQDNDMNSAELSTTDSEDENICLNDNIINQEMLSETLSESVVKKLNSKWKIVYRDQNTKKQSNNSTNEDGEKFGTDMIDIAICDTILSFWQILNAIPFPSKLKSRNASSYMFFRNGIQPTWEDIANQNGGMWRIVIKKHEDRSKYLDTFWLELLMALVGEQFRYSMDITGCVVKRRQKEDRIELWTRGYADEKDQIKDQLIQTAIGEDLKEILGLDDELEYTKHDAVKKMEIVRNAGNRAYGHGANNGGYGVVRENSRNRVDKSVSRKGSIIRNFSHSDVFNPEYKNRSFEHRSTRS